ncbi:hypothetical protein FBR06_04725 [Betaproteobacteria bacterium PRO4]|nr:hypothetical protein [Betaproteobacteria bacterium PRO4]
MALFHWIGVVPIGLTDVLLADINFASSKNAAEACARTDKLYRLGGEHLCYFRQYFYDFWNLGMIVARI